MSEIDNILVDRAQSKRGNVTVTGDYRTGLITISVGLNKLHRAPNDIGENVGFWVDVSEDGCSVLVFGSRGFHVYSAKTKYMLPLVRKLDVKHKSIIGGSLDSDGYGVYVIYDDDSMEYYKMTRGGEFVPSEYEQRRAL